MIPKTLRWLLAAVVVLSVVAAASAAAVDGDAGWPAEALSPFAGQQSGENTSSADFLVESDGPTVNATVGPGEETFVQTVVLRDLAADNETATVESISVRLPGLTDAAVGEVRLEDGGFGDARTLASSDGTGLDGTADAQVAFETFGGAGNETYAVPDGSGRRLVVTVRVASNASLGRFSLRPGTTVELAATSNETYNRSTQTATVAPAAYTVLDTRGPQFSEAVAFVDADHQVDFGNDSDGDTVIEVALDEPVPDVSAAGADATAPAADDFEVLTTDGTVAPTGISIPSPRAARVLLDAGSVDPGGVRSIAAADSASFTDVNGNAVGPAGTNVTATGATVTETGSGTTEVAAGDRVALLARHYNESVSVVSPANVTVLDGRTATNSRVVVFDSSLATPNATYDVVFRCDCNETTRRLAIVGGDEVELSVTAESRNVTMEEHIAAEVTGPVDRKVWISVATTDGGIFWRKQTAASPNGTRWELPGIVDEGEYVVGVSDPETGASDQTRPITVEREIPDGLSLQATQRVYRSPNEVRVEHKTNKSRQVILRTGSPEDRLVEHFSSPRSIDPRPYSEAYFVWYDPEPGIEVFEVEDVDTGLTARTRPFVVLTDNKSLVGIEANRTTTTDVAGMTVLTTGRDSLDAFTQQVRVYATNGTQVRARTIKTRGTTSHTFSVPPGRYYATIDTLYGNFSDRTDVVAVEFAHLPEFELESERRNLSDRQQPTVRVRGNVSREVNLSVVAADGSTIRRQQVETAREFRTVTFEPLAAGTYEIVGTAPGGERLGSTPISVRDSPVTVTAINRTVENGTGLPVSIRSDFERDLNVTIESHPGGYELLTRSVHVDPGRSRHRLYAPPPGQYVVTVADGDETNRTEVITVESPTDGHQVSVSAVNNTVPEGDPVELEVQGDTTLNATLALETTGGQQLYSTDLTVYASQYRFTLSQLQPGEYVVRLTAKNADAADVTDPITVGQSDSGTEPTVNVTALDRSLTTDQQLSVALEADATRTVVLTVTAGDGTQVYQTTTTATAAGSEFTLSGLSAGQYVVEAVNESTGASDTTATITVSDGDGDTGAYINATAVETSITTEDPLQVALSADTDRTVTVTLLTTGGSQVYQTSTTAGAAGSQFQLSGVPAGEYVVEVVNASTGASDTTATITVSDASESQEPFVNATAVSTTVAQGDPIEVDLLADTQRSVTLTLETTNGNELYQTSTTATSTGTRFQLSGVPAGEYVVRVANASADVSDSTAPITVE